MRSKIRWCLIVAATLVASAIYATPSEARLELAYCKVSSHSGYLLVHKASCREGRSVVHVIHKRKPKISRLPITMHIDGWTCRVEKQMNNGLEHSIRCRRNRVDLIWAGIRLHH
jgi:hypothetical protein